MQRYVEGDYEGGMFPSENGGWVKYEDVKAIINPQTAEVSPSNSSDLLTGQEIKLLEQIAYCAMGMFEEKNSQNDGNAKEWERHLENATREYNEFKYS